MRDHEATPPATLRLAREIALRNGARYAYTGNVHDAEGDTTYCHQCGDALIRRDWYDLRLWNLAADGSCPACGARCAGQFTDRPGNWGAQRQPVRLAHYALRTKS